MMYYDANKLVLPEYSFPARAVVKLYQDLMIMINDKYNADDMLILLRISIDNI